LDSVYREIQDCIIPDDDGRILIPKGRMGQLIREAIQEGAMEILKHENGCRRFIRLEIPLDSDTIKLLGDAMGETFTGEHGYLSRTVFSLKISEKIRAEKVRITNLEGAKQK
jgi:hypothetical protein